MSGAELAPRAERFWFPVCMIMRAEKHLRRGMNGYFFECCLDFWSFWSQSVLIGHTADNLAERNCKNI